MLRGTLCEESTSGSTYLPLNRRDASTARERGVLRTWCARSATYHEVCIKTKRWRGEERERTPWRACTYYVTSNPTHPSYSRRRSDVPRTCSTPVCGHVHVVRHDDVHTYRWIHTVTRTVGTHRHARPRSRISRVVPRDGRVASAARLTWPPGWRVALTLSEICAGGTSFFLAISARMSGGATFVPLLHAV